MGRVDEELLRFEDVLGADVRSDQLAKRLQSVGSLFRVATSEQGDLCPRGAHERGGYPAARAVSQAPRAHLSREQARRDPDGSRGEGARHLGELRGVPAPPVPHAAAGRADAR